MKKLLALVLALVMTLGLATVGANAAYKDADSIKYTEAVDVMSAIGVLAGDETGFRPTDTLKRSEGAKIVAYLIAGNKTAEAMQGTGTKFTDLPANHWAAGYMEYLASIGVMGGVGGGKIDPDGQLTATAFAKMLLCALGYDAEIEGFGGTDWAINVQKVANTVGLFDGNRAVVGSAAVTREEAALYSFNTLKAPIVEYDSTVRVSNADGGSVTVGNNKAEYVTSNKESEQTISYELASNGRWVVEFAERYYPVLELESRHDDARGDYSLDEFGRPMREWAYKKADVGTYVAKAGLIATYTKKVSRKDLYDLLGKNTYDNIKNENVALVASIDGVFDADYEIELRDNSGYNTNYTGVWGVAPAFVGTYLDRVDTSAANGSANGVVTEVYMDESGNVYLASYHTWVFQVVSDYTETKGEVTLTAAGDTDITLTDRTLKDDDFEEIKDFKADDYILVTATHEAAGDPYDVQTVAKATLLTGTVDSYVYANEAKTNPDAGSSVTIDGTKYEYDATAGVDTKDNAYTIGQEAIVVLDAYNYVIAVDTVRVLNDFILVSEFANPAGLGTRVSAAAIWTDGTEDTLNNVKSVVDYTSTTNGTILGGDDTDEGDQETTKGTIGGWTGTFKGNDIEDKDQQYRWYTYSKNSSNEYTLYGLGSKYVQAQAVYRQAQGSADVTVEGVANLFGELQGNDAPNKTASNTELHGAYYANDKTVLILKDKNDSVTVYTGVANMPGIKMSNGDAIVSVLARTNGYVVAAYVELSGSATITGSSNDQLVYVRDWQNRTKSGDQTVTGTYRTIGLDGTDGTLTSDGYNNEDATFYVANYVSTNKDGKVVNMQPVEDNHGNIGTAAQGYVAANISNYDDADAKISWNNGVLTLGDEKFTFTDDAKVLLTIVKTTGTVARPGAMISAKGDGNVETRAISYGTYTNGLVKNSDAAFVAVTGTGVNAGREIAAAVKGYDLSFDYVGRAASAGSLQMKELYITVYEAVENNYAYTGTFAASATENTKEIALETAAAGYATRTLAVDNAYVLPVGATFTLVSDDNEVGTLSYKELLTATEAQAKSTGTLATAGAIATTENIGANNNYTIYEITATASDGTTKDVTYFATKASTGCSVNIQSKINGAGATEYTDNTALYSVKIGGETYTANDPLLISGEDYSITLTPAAGTTITDVSYSTTNTNSITKQSDGSWTGTINVTAAGNLIVTTQSVKSITVHGNQTVSASWVAGAANGTVTVANGTTGTITGVSTNDTLILTLDWADTKDWNKAVFADTTANTQSLQGTVGASVVAFKITDDVDDIYLGAPSKSVTVTNGYTVSWDAGTANIGGITYSFGAGSVESNGSAVQLPRGAVLALAKTEGATHFGRYVTAVDATGVTGTAETKYVTTDGGKPTFANQYNVAAANDDAGTLTVTETTAAIYLPSAAIDVSNANVTSVTLSSDVTDGVFSDGENGYFVKAADTTIKAAVVLTGHTAEANYAVTVTAGSTGITVDNAASLNGTWASLSDSTANVTFDLTGTDEGAIGDNTNDINFAATYSD